MCCIARANPHWRTGGVVHFAVSVTARVPNGARWLRRFTALNRFPLDPLDLSLSAVRASCEEFSQKRAVVSRWCPDLFGSGERLFVIQEFFEGFAVIFQAIADN